MKNNTMNFNLFTPTRLIFGTGALDELGAQKLPGKKALLLLSDGKSAQISGAMEKTQKQLKIAGIAYHVCATIHENPTRELVMEAAVCAKVNGCDFILALGGGAVLDSAVAIAAMATNPGDLWNYVNGGSGKGLPLVNEPLPIVTITLTAGTASEINNWGVITKTQTHEKIGFGGIPELFPRLAIVDPALMTTVPAKYTAYQGFDALFHNTEVMISNGVNIMSETISLSAIEQISKYLPRAVTNGKNIEAREHVAYGSTIAGIAMQLTSTTAKHSMEHAMSAYHPNLPHGAGLIMISKAFYEFFIEKHACDGQFIKMARAMGIANADKPQDFISALMQLQKDCGVDELRMKDYGFAPDEAMTLALNARATMGGLFLANPCEMTDTDCAGIFEKSYR